MARDSILLNDERILLMFEVDEPLSWKGAVRQALKHLDHAIEISLVPLDSGAPLIAQCKEVAKLYGVPLPPALEASISQRNRLRHLLDSQDAFKLSQNDARAAVEDFFAARDLILRAMTERYRGILHMIERNADGTLGPNASLAGRESIRNKGISNDGLKRGDAVDQAHEHLEHACTVSLVRSRRPFHLWCADVAQTCKIVLPANFADLVNIRNRNEHPGRDASAPTLTQAREAVEAYFTVADWIYESMKDAYRESLAWHWDSQLRGAESHIMILTARDAETNGRLAALEKTVQKMERENKALVDATNNCREAVRKIEGQRDEAVLALEIVERARETAEREADTVRLQCQGLNDAVQQTQARLVAAEQLLDATKEAWNSTIETLRQSDAKRGELADDITQINEELTRAVNERNDLRCMLPILNSGAVLPSSGESSTSEKQNGTSCVRPQDFDNTKGPSRTPHALESRLPRFLLFAFLFAAAGFLLGLQISLARLVTPTKKHSEGHAGSSDFVLQADAGLSERDHPDSGSSSGDLPVTAVEDTPCPPPTPQPRCGACP